MKTIACAGVLLVSGSIPAAAQVDQFQWHGSVEPGAAVEIRAVNGSIRTMAGDAPGVRVEAVRRAGRGDGENVVVEVVEHSGGVTICTVYPSPGAARRVLRMNRCRPGRSPANLNSSAVIDYVVHLPEGVRLIASTVNGEVHVGTPGSVTARTVNGNITFLLAADAFAAVRAYTFNGQLVSDFAVEFRRSLTGRRHGIVGAGTAGRAADIRASSLNGSIMLRRSRD